MIYLYAYLLVGIGFVLGSWQEWTENETPFYGRLFVIALWPLAVYLLMPPFGRNK